jgi:hypothetical protein
MALQKEVWIADIQENLYNNNEFIQKATDHSMWISNKTVHIPQAGANPSVKKNRAVLPAAISQRTDTDLTYDMAEYTTDPILLTNIEELQINYAKRQSVLSQHIATLGDVIGNQTLYAWAPAGAGTYVKTTGSAVSTALAPTATSTRLAITLANIASAKALLDSQNIPANGRILLMPSDIYNGQLLAISDAIQMQSYGNSALPSGVISKMFGFDIMLRPSVVVYDNSGTPALKAVDADGTPTTEATTDNMACLAFHPNYVAKALGTTDVFYDEDKPEYYGSIFSALVMHGASKMRTDQKGIVAIVQAN